MVDSQTALQTALKSLDEAVVRAALQKPETFISAAAIAYRISSLHPEAATAVARIYGKWSGNFFVDLLSGVVSQVAASLATLRQGVGRLGTIDSPLRRVVEETRSICQRDLSTLVEVIKTQSDEATVSAAPLAAKLAAAAFRLAALPKSKDIEDVAASSIEELAASAYAVAENLVIFRLPVGQWSLSRRQKLAGMTLAAVANVPALVASFWPADEAGRDDRLEETDEFDEWNWDCDIVNTLGEAHCISMVAPLLPMLLPVMVREPSQLEERIWHSFATLDWPPEVFIADLYNCFVPRKENASGSSVPNRQLSHIGRKFLSHSLPIFIEGLRQAGRFEFARQLAVHMTDLSDCVAVQWATAWLKQGPRDSLLTARVEAALCDCLKETKERLGESSGRAKVCVEVSPLAVSTYKLGLLVGAVPDCDFATQSVRLLPAISKALRLSLDGKPFMSLLGGAVGGWLDSLWHRALNGQWKEEDGQTIRDVTETVIAAAATLPLRSAVKEELRLSVLPQILRVKATGCGQRRAKLCALITRGGTWLALSNESVWKTEAMVSELFHAENLIPPETKLKSVAEWDELQIWKAIDPQSWHRFLAALKRS